MSSEGRVLVVDDNPANRAILEEILGDDYDVRTASSGEECLAVVPRFGPDVILLDVMMPGMDGFEVCRHLRQDESLGGAKIIMVSARAMVSDRLHGYECGADDYVTKPFDEGELFSKVRVYMRLKSVEEVDRMKTDVLSLISHTTHTPLNGIIGSTEILLLDENPDPEEQRQWIRTIARCAEQLHRLFQKVLLLTQLSSGALELDRQPTDPADVVADAMGQVAGAASERGVEITQQLDATAPVPLDHEHLAMALAALLDNAVRFSEPGGTVELCLTADEQQICIAVSDHGQGIEADQLSRLFQPLEDADVTHHSQGDGLSLALAQQILLQHGGTIEVESEKGMQTTFRLLLPADAAARATA